MLHKLLFIAFLIMTLSAYSQQKRIEIVHADNSTIDEENYPGATVLLGNVYMEHDGITLRSKKAIHYKNDNFLKAFGDVVLNQGDSISQTSTYVEYNGNTKLARSWGNVILKDALMTLTTDTLDFNRTEQLLYYRYGAIIKDTTNVLESKEGNYFLKTSKFQALSNVVLTNPDYVLESDHLNYFTNNGQAFLYGPSTITGKDNFIYTEKGFYDTQTDISNFKVSCAENRAKMVSDKRWAEYTKEQAAKWEDFNRVLGKLEGAITRMHSSTKTSSPNIPSAGTARR